MKKCPKCGSELTSGYPHVIFRNGHYYCKNCPEIKNKPKRHGEKE